jgi:hypothetical protein
MSITERSAPVNAVAERHRDYLTKGINTAISRARLTVHSLESIQAALRHKEATTEEVVAWLKSEGLWELVARHTRGLS